MKSLLCALAVLFIPLAARAQAITLRAAGTVVTASGSPTSITPSKPTGTISTDYMIAAVFVPNGTVATPTGWTLITSVINATSGNTYAYRALGSQATTTFTITSATQGAAAVITSWIGVNTTTQMDVAGVGQTNAANTIRSGPALTTVTDNAEVILISSSNDTSGANMETWSDGTVAVVVNGGLRRSPTNTIMLGMSNAFQTPPGATGQINVIGTRSIPSDGISIALRPVPPPPLPTGTLGLMGVGK